MILVQLFWAFFQIGICSFGGGYASLSLIRSQAVELHHWITMTEFGDITAISQMTPGPIAINAATFVGVKAAGIWGGIVATAGCVCGPVLIVTALIVFLSRHKDNPVFRSVLEIVRPSCAALIASAGITLAIQLVSPYVNASWLSFFSPSLIMLLCIGAVSWYLLRYRNMDPVAVMLIGGAANLLLRLVLG